MYFKPDRYDWSVWDRESIIAMMKEVQDKVVYRPLPIDTLNRKLVNHIKKYMPIRSIKSREPQVETGRVYIGGGYYSHRDKDREKSIEVCFAYNLKDETITVSRRHFNRICVRIADVILHEIIHMRQARKRKFRINNYSLKTKTKTPKKLAEQIYLADPDEIDAYAFNMACELTDKYGRNMLEIKNYLARDQKGSRSKFDTWRSYLKAFDYDIDHHVIRRLKTRSMYYLRRSQVGRPFPPKDWVPR
jgi:hypothetical protein